jgi:RimJ/RimL family protein N-acetyltransferase
MNKIFLKHHNYLIEELEYDDFQDCKRIYETSPQAILSRFWGQVNDLDDFTCCFYRMILGMKEADNFPLMCKILDQKNMIIGFCGFRLIDKTVLMVEHEKKEAELFFTVVAGTEEIVLKDSIGILLKYGFEELNLKRISYKLESADNDLAGILEKLGFKREALLREDFFENNKWHDFYNYALVDKDWL